MKINYEQLLNIPVIFEPNLYKKALKKIFDYCCTITRNQKPSGEYSPNKPPIIQGINLTFNEERLEFLGDGLLQSVVTELIFETFPNDAHGSLSSLRSRLVRNSTLAQIVKKMGLVNSILECHVKDNENNNDGVDVNAVRPLTMKNAADTFEALIGASLIDRGYEETRTWIRSIYAKYDLIQQYLNEDNFLDILQMYTKSSLPKFIYTVDNQMVTISTVFQNKYYESKNKLKQKAKQEVVGKIVQDLISQKLIPENILVLRGCGQKNKIK